MLSTTRGTDQTCSGGGAGGRCRCFTATLALNFARCLILVTEHMHHLVHEHVGARRRSRSDSRRTDGLGAMPGLEGRCLPATPDFWKLTNSHRRDEIEWHVAGRILRNHFPAITGRGLDDLAVLVHYAEPGGRTRQGSTISAAAPAKRRSVGSRSIVRVPGLPCA